MEELRIVGRDAELSDVRGFATGATGSTPGSDPRGLLIAGEPGLGKTTIWEAGVVAARAAGTTVLVAQPAESDVRRSFSGLSDLLHELGDEVIDRLPSPQRRALAIALLRTEPAAGDDDHATGPAILGILRGLASRGPVLIAIDDLQWLDGSTADAVAFAARRVEAGGVRLLLARRSGTVTGFERDLRGVPVNRMELVPLSVGAIRRLIFDRLGLELPRRQLRDLHAYSGGNPLFALELAAARWEREERESTSGQQPAVLNEVLGARIAGLPQSLQDVLLAVSLAPPSTPPELAVLFGPESVQEAVDEGLVVLDERAVRVGHPLMASVARARSSPQARRRLHGQLATVVEDDERRLRHEASATAAPDDGLAAALARAGDRAAARGAAEDAADLASEAFRLTPEADLAREERVVTLCERLLMSGDQARATDLISRELPSMTPGRPRARARLLLTEARYQFVPHSSELINAEMDAALADAPTDEELMATVLARRSHHRSVGRVDEIRAAEAEARRALELSIGRWPDAAAEAARSLAWALHLRGRSIADLRRRMTATGAEPPGLFRGLERAAAEGLLARGRVAEARATLQRLLALADERGEALSFVAIRLQLIELELRAGGWAQADAMLEDWADSPERSLTTESAYTRCRSFLSGGRGDARDAVRWAAEALAHSEERGFGWDRLESLRATGLAALLAGRAAQAAKALETVWTHMRRAGVLEPGAFPVAPDLVEAYVEIGERAKARRIARSLIRFGALCDHPWAAANGARALALVDLASGDPTAGDRSWAAASALGQLDLRFDEARALLALGRVQRRSRQWGDARRALEAARAAFEAIESNGWAEIATGELGRIGGRRPPSAGSLTNAERHVARLAADGLSNKEIAQSLSISVDTVERHLSNAYAKLGVQSRSQLARRLGPAERD